MYCCMLVTLNILSFTINILGPCLFKDASLNNTERTYTLRLDGNWTVFQTCSNNLTLATCNSDGSWTPIILCPPQDSKNEMLNYITFYSLIQYAVPVITIDDNPEGISTVMTSMKEISTSFISTVDVQTANELQRSYIYWVVPTLIIVLLVITLLAVLVLSLICKLIIFLIYIKLEYFLLR